MFRPIFADRVARGCPGWRPFLCLTVCASLVAGFAGPAAAGDGKDSPGDLISQFRSLRSLHFSAAATIQLFDSAILPDVAGVTGEPIAGRLEYWASGNRYRINSHVDDKKLPAMHVEVAFDGSTYQLLLSNGVLSYSGTDKAGVVGGLPNPLFELLQVHYPLTDENSHLRLRLKDLQRGDPPAVKLSEATWTKVEQGAAPLLERATFPGGVYEGQSYEFRVYAPAGLHHMPSRIERVADGRVMTSTEFSGYRKLKTTDGAVFLPQRVTLRGFDSKGQERARISFVITSIEVDADIPQEAFVIRQDRARAIWDDYQRIFVSP